MEPERLSVEALNLKPSSVDKLLFRNINFCDQLTDLTSDQILSFHNVGVNTLRDIRKALAAKRMCLKDDFLADSEDQKNLIENIPKLIQEIKWDVIRLEKTLKHLSVDLERLY